METESRHSHKAPGRADRIGISLMEFFKRWPDDEAAEAWFEQKRWPNKVACPRCGSVRVSRVESRNPMPWHCKDCRRYFSVKWGTLMQSSKLGCQVWLLAFYLLSTGLKGTSSLKLHRDLGVTQKTAWYLAHRIREAMNLDDFNFCGPIEADETYIGGKEKNKHRDKRSPGRGPAGKLIVAGVKDRCSNAMSVKVVPDTSSETLVGMVSDHAKPGTEVFTDEARGYQPLRRSGYVHRSVAHSLGQYVDGKAHTNGIESFWAMLKRGYHGTFHQLSWEHFDRYANEFSYRHNVRPLDTERQMDKLAENIDNKHLPYKELISNGTWAKRRAEEFAV